MTNEMIYRGRYYNGSRKSLVEAAQAAMSEYRFQHVLRVEEMAVALAEKWGVDAEKASVAALTHDYAKERSDADFLAKIAEKQLDPDLVNWGTNYLNSFKFSWISCKILIKTCITC